MGFYEKFIDHYDVLVSWENRERREKDFWVKIFSENNIKTILDCACGTGQHVVMFNQLGYKALGADLSPAMIEKSKEHAKKYNIDTSFKQVSFLDLEKSYVERFDSIVCIGNSLPHLMTLAEINNALLQMYNMLEDNGILILEMRNYDLLISEKPHIFPFSLREKEGFIYVLDYFQDKIVFNIVHMDLENKKCNTFKTEYNPVPYKKLTKTLNEVGFSTIKTFGGYNFEEFDLEKNSRYIIVCHK